MRPPHILVLFLLLLSLLQLLCSCSYLRCQSLGAGGTGCQIIGCFIIRQRLGTCPCPAPPPPPCPCPTPPPSLSCTLTLTILTAMCTSQYIKHKSLTAIAQCAQCIIDTYMLYCTVHSAQNLKMHTMSLI